MLLLPCGRTQDQPIAVKDLVALILKAVRQEDSTSGRILNAAGPRPMSMRRLVELILSTGGKRRLLIPLSHSMSYALASLMEKTLRESPITRDNCLSLERDYLCSDEENHALRLLGGLSDIKEALQRDLGPAPR